MDAKWRKWSHLCKRKFWRLLFNSIFKNTRICYLKSHYWCFFGGLWLDNLKWDHFNLLAYCPAKPMSLSNYRWEDILICQWTHFRNSTWRQHPITPTIPTHPLPLPLLPTPTSITTESISIATSIIIKIRTVHPYVQAPYWILIPKMLLTVQVKIGWGKSPSLQGEHLVCLHNVCLVMVMYKWTLIIVMYNVGPMSWGHMVLLFLNWCLKFWPQMRGGHKN